MFFTPTGALTPPASGLIAGEGRGGQCRVRDLGSHAGSALH